MFNLQKKKKKKNIKTQTIRVQHISFNYTPPKSCIIWLLGNSLTEPVVEV